MVPPYTPALAFLRAASCRSGEDDAGRADCPGGRSAGRASYFGPCPTCSHTLARIDDEIFCCERCGTLGDSNASGRSEWIRLGIAESIDTPDERNG